MALYQGQMYSIVMYGQNSNFPFRMLLQRQKVSRSSRNVEKAVGMLLYKRSRVSRYTAAKSEAESDWLTADETSGDHGKRDAQGGTL